MASQHVAASMITVAHAERLIWYPHDKPTMTGDVQDLVKTPPVQMKAISASTCLFKGQIETHLAST